VENAVATGKPAEGYRNVLLPTRWPRRPRLAFSHDSCPHMTWFGSTPFLSFGVVKYQRARMTSRYRGGNNVGSGQSPQVDDGVHAGFEGPASASQGGSSSWV
jgi:hypothetical protein